MVFMYMAGLTAFHLRYRLIIVRLSFRFAYLLVIRFWPD